MQETVHSDIRSTISLLDEEIYSQDKKTYALCETTPQEACAKKIAKQKGMYDKRTSLTDAVKRYLTDGINIGIGGFGNIRIPVASIHEIIRQGARDLTLSVQYNSICCELLAGAMILNPGHLSIRRIELAWSGHEIIGNARLLRYLTNNKMIQLDEYASSSMSARFKAGAMGVPFLPTIDHGGSDMAPTNRGKMTICPFTGKNIYLVAACRPDLALIHVQAADMYGNSRIFGDHCTCPEIAQASVNTIVTTEQIIDNSSIRNYPNLTTIPLRAVDAIVDQPFGATPGACYGNYWFDTSGILDFRAICEDFCKTGNKEKLRAYYNKHIFDVENFDDFLEQKPYPILQKICQQDGNRPVILN